MNQNSSNVIALPAAPVMLELKSDRLREALRALMDAGFKVSNTGRINQFRIEDDVQATKSKVKP